MTADLEAIARRAVACKGWRWRPGMRTTTGYRVSDDDAETSMPTLFSDDVPDLTDPATLGCLLALVREAWGDPYLCCVGNRETGWRLDGYAAVEDIHSYRLETETLVAALEAAP